MFVLSIGMLLAQVETIDIATPSNGLSNNQVDDFDVNASGTILNNSATGGVAQIGTTTVAANPNITEGSEADLILFEVTTSNNSSLTGIIEVFGSEAGVIIANPNGITCNGCGFINTSNVDLVTGTSNFSGNDLTSFSIVGDSFLRVLENGLVNDAVADELNLASRYIRISSQVQANDTLRILTGNETYYHTTNTLTSNISVSANYSIAYNSRHPIYIHSGRIEANSIEVISTEENSIYAVPGLFYGIINDKGDISAETLKIDSNVLFRNMKDGSINAANLEITAVDRFINNSSIVAVNLVIATNEFYNNFSDGTDRHGNIIFHNKKSGNIVVSDTFSLFTPDENYINTGNVESYTLNLTTTSDFTHELNTLNGFTFYSLGITTKNNVVNNSDLVLPVNLNITANNFSNNNATIIAHNFNVLTEGYFSNRNATIITPNFNAIVEGYFRNGTQSGIRANNFNLTTGKDFANRNSEIHVKYDFNVTVGKNFYNTAGDNYNNYYDAKIYVGDFNANVRGYFKNAYSAKINADDFNANVGDYFQK